MANQGGIERSLNLVVSVPPGLGANGFETIVEDTADLEVGSYLLESGCGATHLRVAKELSETADTPGVVYDAREQDLSQPAIEQLALNGVTYAVVSGKPSAQQRALREAGIGVIQQPLTLTTSKNSLQQGINLALSFEQEGNRSRLYIPKEIPMAALTQCVSYAIDHSSRPIRKVSLYIKNGDDVAALNAMYIDKQHTLKLNERIVVPAAPDTAELIDAVHEAQERFLAA